MFSTTNTNDEFTSVTKKGNKGRSNQKSDSSAIFVQMSAQTVTKSVTQTNGVVKGSNVRVVQGSTPKSTGFKTETDKLKECRENGTPFICATLFGKDKDVYRAAFGQTTDHDLYQTRKTNTNISIMAAYNRIISYNSRDKISFVIGAIHASTKEKTSDVLSMLVMYLRDTFAMTDIEILESKFGDDQYTVLNAAAWNLSVECLKFCISRGADVNYKNKANEDIRGTLSAGWKHANKGVANHRGITAKASTVKFNSTLHDQHYKMCIDHLTKHAEHVKMMAMMEQMNDDERREQEDREINEARVRDGLAPINIEITPAKGTPVAFCPGAPVRKLKPITECDEEILAEASQLDDVSVQLWPDAKTVPMTTPTRQTSVSIKPSKVTAKGKVTKQPTATKSALCIINPFELLELDDEDGAIEVHNETSERSLIRFTNDKEGNEYSLECFDSLVEMYRDERSIEDITTAKIAFTVNMDKSLAAVFIKMCDEEL